MEKQIEEMAKAIFRNCHCGLLEGEAEMIARFVIEEQGYRKASDVAKEIFKEIGKILYKCDKFAERDKSEYGELIVGDIGFAVAELKKKYIGEDTNVTTKESEKDNG